MNGLDVEAVLREHEDWVTPGATSLTICTCRERIDVPDFALSDQIAAAHRAHVAAVLRVEIESALGDAWDEGYRSGAADAMTSMDARAEFNRSPFTNPYRAPLAATEGDRQ